LRRESENLQGQEATLTHTLTQTGTRVQYYDWAGCAVRQTCLRMGERGIAVSVALGLAGGVAVPEPASKGQVLSPP
jgi:hypothetical protein